MNTNSENHGLEIEVIVSGGLYWLVHCFMNTDPGWIEI